LLSINGILLKEQLRNLSSHLVFRKSSTTCGSEHIDSTRVSGSTTSSVQFKTPGEVTHQRQQIDASASSVLVAGSSFLHIKWAAQRERSAKNYSHHRKGFYEGIIRSLWS
jgi:hypothetical protein